MASASSVMTSRFWQLEQPLLLASASATRRQMLERCGIPVVVQPSDIDERALEAVPEAADEVMATRLARAKACNVSASFQNRLVLGADQTLHCDGRSFHKPIDRDAAFQQLSALAGKTHRLTSAFCLAQGGQVVAEGHSVAIMSMRPLSAEFLATYLDAAGDNALASVGCYQIEGTGSQLFADIKGDHFTVLGLPLLHVLAALRHVGALAE